MTENPLQKYVDEFDQEVAQPPLSAEDGQYLLKALDYLVIYAEKNNQPELVEQPRHDELEVTMTDVIMYSRQENTDG